MTTKPDERKGPKLTWIIIPVIFLFVVIIPVVTFMTGRWVDWVLRFPLFPPFPLNIIIGPVIIVIGFLMCLGSIYQLYRAGLGLPWGDVKEPAQSVQLVTTGLYAYTRNPMILGMLILLHGIGWLAQSLTAMIIIPLIVFLLLWAWLKRKEEPQLEQRFGEAYHIYKQRTSLIIPLPRRRVKKNAEPSD